MRRSLFTFSDLYYHLQDQSQQLTPKERVRATVSLFEEMKESGQFLLNPEHRNILNSHTRSLRRIIFDYSGTFPNPLLADPLDYAWEIEPENISYAQVQAYVLLRSQKVLFKLREFDSLDALQGLFDTPKLAAYQEELPAAMSKGERISKTIDYLLQKQLSCHAPVLLEFLTLLRDREPVVSGLRDELELLHNQCALVLRVTPEETFHLSFANRESEKKSIRSFLIYHFYLAIQAPSGMGKTYLLREIQKEIEKFNWIPVWIDFASESHRLLRDNEALFLQEFCQQAFGAEIFDLSNQKRALEEIGDKMTWMDSEIVIFLDHADDADSKLLEWLRDKFLFPFATEWVPVRVVTASQQLLPPWHTPNHEHAQTLTLSPLDSSAICSIISDVVTRFGSEAAKERKAQQDEAWQNDLETMAFGLLKLTGGHPETIARLLRHAVEQDGFVTPAYFTDHRAAKESLAKVTGEYVL